MGPVWRYKFSKVSSPLTFVYKMDIELTFENIFQAEDDSDTYAGVRIRDVQVRCAKLKGCWAGGK